MADHIHSAVAALDLAIGFPPPWVRKVHGGQVGHCIAVWLIKKDARCRACSMMPAGTPIVAHVAPSMSGSPTLPVSPLQHHTQGARLDFHAAPRPRTALANTRPKRGEMRGWVRRLTYCCQSHPRTRLRHVEKRPGSDRPWSSGRGWPIGPELKRSTAPAHCRRPPVAVGDDAAWWYRKRDLLRVHQVAL